MSKTTVLLDFGSGPSTVVLPATVYIRAVSVFASGNKIILPAPSPVALDAAGLGSVSLDDGIVWGFVVSVPSYRSTEEFRYVHASEATVQYKDLLAVSAPPASEFGVPDWVSSVLGAVAGVQDAAENADLSEIAAGTSATNAGLSEIAAGTSAVEAAASADRATAPTAVAMAAEDADETSAFRVQSDARLSATFARISSIDLACFLEPGEAMPNDGVLDAQPLLQRVVNAVAAAVSTDGPKAVRMPAGKFRINSSVEWKSGVGFIGAGRSNTRILPYGIAVFGLMNVNWDTSKFLDDVVFADMTIDCINQLNDLNQVGTKGIALRFMRNGLFERVRIIDSWATSFGCDYLQDTVFVNCTAIRSGRGVIGFNSFGAGFGIGVGNFERESVTVSGCYAIDCHSGGFFIERLPDIAALGVRESRGFTITGCTSVGGYNGLRDAGSSGLIVSASNFLSNTNAGIQIDGYPSSGRHGGKDGNISGCVISNNSLYGVLIGAASTGGYTFANNTVADNGGAGFYAPSDAQMGAGWRWLSNRIVRNGAGGIILDCSLAGRPEIVGNTIRENGAGDGIRIAGDTFEPKIVDNIIQGHQGAGINLTGSTRFCTDPTIRGNATTENALGWMVNEKATNDVTMITGNRQGAAFASVTNLVTTPSYESGVTGATVINGFSAPVQIVSSDAKFGTAYARATVTATTNLVRIARVSGALAGTYTLSAWVRTSREAIIRVLGIGYWASNASQRAWNSGGHRSRADWQRASLTVTLPANGSMIDFDIALDSAAVGMVLDVDGVNITKGSTLWPHIDGNQPNCAWLGTAQNSTSTWALTNGSLSQQLLAASGESFTAERISAGITSGLSISVAQPLTLYTVVTGATVGSMRSALRSSASGDRFAMGRNTANTNWLATSVDASASLFFAQQSAAAAPAVGSAVRDSSGVALHMRGASTVTTAIASYEAATATMLVNDTGVAHTIVYVGAHDATKRAAVMDVLAAWYHVS